MKTENFQEKFKKFCQKVGKRNFIIVGAVVLIVAAIAINVVIFSREDDGYDYNQPAGMNPSDSTQDSGNKDENPPKDDEDASVDSYFSSVQVSRQRTRDEAIEVLQSVVDNESSTETAKNEALAEINKLAGVMAKESNIETLVSFFKTVLSVSLTQVKRQLNLSNRSSKTRSKLWNTITTNQK